MGRRLGATSRTRRLGGECWPFLPCRVVVVVIVLAQLVAAQPAGQEHEQAVAIVVGGSLPLTGWQSSAARAALQGFQLLAEIVNETGQFHFGADRTPLVLHVDIRDDKGDPLETRRNYDALLEEGKVHFLLGPSSSRDSLHVAKAAEPAAVIVLFPGAVVASIYNGGFRHVFTTSAVASTYMSGAMEVVALRGARTVSLIWEADSSSSSEICGGALTRAKGLGLEVRGASELDENAVMEQVRQLKDMAADVLVVCGRLQSAEQLLITARALSYSPEAAVMSGAASAGFVRSVRPAIANYILSPTPWYPSLAWPCEVFGSSEGFAAKYRRRWGEEPQFQSAEAAAAGIAILKAAEMAGSLDAAALRNAMLGMDVQTFFGQLSFYENGTRRDVSVFTQQVQPLDGRHDRRVRYRRSSIVPVNATSPPLYPMPAWTQKEIDIYPCKAGSVLVAEANSSLPADATGDDDSLAATVGRCLQCPVGRFRNPRAVTCELCEAGHYGEEEGATACAQCPLGAYCPEGERLGRPNATAGYYRFPKGSLMIMQCSPPSVCMGNNECRGHHKGILCAQCQSGFARVRHEREASCVLCRDNRWNAFLIVVTVILYSLYIWVILKATLSACKSTPPSAIHTVILKICVNYLQFAGTAFEATEFRSMLMDICGQRADFLLPVVTLPTVVQNPFQALKNLDCLFESAGLELYQACILVGLFLMPVALLLKVAYTFVRKEIIIPWLRPHLHARTRSMRVWWLAVCPRRGSPPSGSAASPYPASVPSTDRLQGAGIFSPARAVLPQGLALSPYSGRGLDDCTPMASPWHTRTSSGKSSKLVTRLVNSSVVMSFVLYPLVIRLLVVGFECKDYDVFRHKHNLDVVCTSKEHVQWISWSSVGLVVYGFGTPVTVFCVLYRVRGRLFQSDIRRRFGFLYNGFELRYYYFEAVYMVRKVVMVLFFTFPTMYVRMVLMLFTSWAFILLHISTRPFDNRSFHCLDRLEALSLRALSGTVTARLAYDIRRQVWGDFYQDLAKHWTIDILLISVPLGLHLWFVGFACWSLFRNTVLKHLAAKNELWPDRLTWIQRQFLRLDRHRNKANFGGMEEGYPWIDVSELSKPEQEYLHCALHDTLYRYMYGSGERVHPGDITAAIQQAVVKCQRRRRKRAAKLEQLYRQHASVGGLWSTVLRWQGELTLALHGPGRLDCLDEEKGCWSLLYERMAECCVFIHSHMRQSQAPHRPPLPPVSCPRAEQEVPQGFTVEDLYDELMPIWQDICEGRGPTAQPLEPDWLEQVAVQPTAHIVQGPPRQSAYGSELSMLSAGSMEKAKIAADGHLPTMVRHCSDVSQCMLEHQLLLQRQQSREVEITSLLHQRDALLSENERLRADCDLLRRRTDRSLSAAAWVPDVVAEARRMLADLGSPASASAVDLPGASELPVAAAGVGCEQGDATVSPSSSQARPAGAGSAANMIPADAVTSPGTASDGAPATALDHPLPVLMGKGEVLQASKIDVVLLPGVDVSGTSACAGSPTRLQPPFVRPPSTSAWRAPVTEVAPKAPPALTLPGVYARMLQGRLVGGETDSTHGSPMPWSGAMRKAAPGVWRKGEPPSPFAFMGAARPARSTAWQGAAAGKHASELGHRR